MKWMTTSHSDPETPIDLIYEAVKSFFAALGMVAVAIAIGLWQAGFFETLVQKRHDYKVSCNRFSSPEKARGHDDICNPARRR